MEAILEHFYSNHNLWCAELVKEHKRNLIMYWHFKLFLNRNMVWAIKTVFQTSPNWSFSSQRISNADRDLIHLVMIPQCSWETKVNTMDADALALSVARTSATILLTMWDKRGACLPWGRISTTCFIPENANLFVYFIINNSVDLGSMICSSIPWCRHQMKAFST